VPWTAVGWLLTIDVEVPIQDNEEHNGHTSDEQFGETPPQNELPSTQQQSLGGGVAEFGSHVNQYEHNYRNGHETVHNIT
jgi:hypothetical protein